jgi:polar amino acid transport system substrate-binding protein
MQRADPRVADLVQAGKIRVALFLPQYTKDPVTGALQGVGTGFLAIEIARVLAARLGIEVRLIEQPSPLETVACLKSNACDIAFLGIEPSRAVEIDFSAPIFQFDYTYLVPAGSSIDRADGVDRPGVRVTIVRGHASALVLRRKVTRAELIGADLPDGAFELLRAEKADAFALPREQLLDYSIKLPGSRVLEDSYGINLVAMAVAKGQAGWLAYCNEFIEEAKASGLIQRAIDRGALRGFEVALAGKSY